MGHVRQATADDDGVGVEEVDDLRQRAGNAVGVAGQRPLGAHHARGCAVGDRAGVAAAGAVAILGQGGAGDVPFQAAFVAAETFRIWQVLGVGPRQRIVAPFAADAVQTGHHLAVHDNTAAAAGAQDNSEYNLLAGGRAIGRFRQRETIRVVLDTDRTRQEFAEVAVERVAVHPNGVGVFYHAGGGHDGAGNTHADTAAHGQFRLGRTDQTGHTAQRRFVAAGIWHAPAQHRRSLRIEHDNFDFRAAEIYAYAPVGLHAVKA